MSIRFGDIYLYNIGCDIKESKEKFVPVIIIIDKVPEKRLIVAPIRRIDKSLYSPTHIFIGRKEGVKYNSMIELENSIEIQRKDLSKYLSHIYDLNTLLLISKRYSGYLNGKYLPSKKENIRCLCRSCLINYRNVPNYLVRRTNLKHENKCV